jgi:hypothetical protein
MKKVTNQRNYVVPRGKTFTQPSMTVPDQTMSLRTIMERYATGMPIGGIKEAIWDEDPENTMGINPKTLDLVDIQELKLINQQDIDDAKQYKLQLKQTAQAVKELSEEAGSN